jgi:class 3 adenylate cyclase
MNIPETRYAMNGDLAVAFQVIGDSGPDVLVMPNWFSNVEAIWDVPEMRRWFEALASFTRVILFDQPGTGVSDPISFESPPTLEQWVDTARVVLDAAGSSEVTVACVDGAFGCAALLCATHPARIKGFIAMDCYARTSWDEDYPFGIPSEVLDDLVAGIVGLWGTGEAQHSINWDMPWNDEIRKTWARYERQMATPKVAERVLRLLADLDVRQVLPAIRCPTLVLHHAESTTFSIEHGQYIAEHIPDAKLVTLPGRNMYPIFDDWRDSLEEVREFITGTRGEKAEEDRMLATVLFTDIVESTSRAARMGDSGWRALLDAHDAVVRSQLARFRGHEVKTVGDGFLATFDGPQRAIKCALAIRESMRPLGIEVRAGLHTGECEKRGEDVGGIAVHIGARVASEAGASEVLVSSTVKDLVVGSGLAFEDRGSHELKGVPGEWRLFAVAS